MENTGGALYEMHKSNFLLFYKAPGLVQKICLNIHIHTVRILTYVILFLKIYFKQSLSQITQLSLTVGCPTRSQRDTSVPKAL